MKKQTLEVMAPAKSKEVKREIETRIILLVKWNINNDKMLKLINNSYAINLSKIKKSSASVFVRNPID
jgi:hypothetical protein